MLALILSLVFGLSSGFFMARAFDKSVSYDPIKYFAINSMFYCFVFFAAKHQNVVPIFLKEQPFKNFYDWLIVGTFFFSLAVTLLVQRKKKATV